MGFLGFGAKTGAPVTSKTAIDAFLTRGVSAVYPEKDKVAAMFAKGERLSMYLGIDPTGPTLHLGHAIALRKLRAFQDMGHKVILLIGSFTAQIGDPTDKLAARVRLTEGQVLENAKAYKAQAARILRFSGENAAELRYNGDWLSKLTFADVIELAAHSTVQEMLKRDMFERRMKEGSPIYMHEFLYPLMQGYDSVAMNVDGEIGGNDQLFNMLVGRDLVRSMLKKEKFVLTMKLLTDTAGKKMGKSEGNMASLSDTPEDMFGKVMSWTDGMIVNGFELCTDLPTDQLALVEKRLQQENPRDIKMELASAIVEGYFGEEAAVKAKSAFVNIFTRDEAPEDVLETSVPKGTLLRDALASLGESNSELTRLFKQGAVETTEGEKMTDPFMKVEKTAVYRVGKRRFLKVIVK